MSAETAQSLVLGVYFVGAIVIGTWFWVWVGHEFATQESEGPLETGLNAVVAVVSTLLFALFWPLVLLALPFVGLTWLIGWMIRKF